MTLAELLQATPVDGDSVQEFISCQVAQARESATKAGKPYLEIEITDGTATERFKVWQEAPAYDKCSDLQAGDFVRLEAQFRRSLYGLGVDRLQLRFLNKLEIEELLAGSPERCVFLQAEYDGVEAVIAGIVDPRLRLVGQTFLQQYGERFRRAAAARDYHHARRGGLLEHVAQMMRAGVALESVYPALNGDLVRVGVLLHDCGKLWENDYAADSFVMPYTLIGELIGHITVGVELCNSLWRSLQDREEFKTAHAPSSELVRQHLLHLIASHHGQREFGAPVTPRTAEGWMLHYLDNIDARLEMLQRVYAEKAEIAPMIYERRMPLEGHAVTPLAKFVTNP